jgi:NADPH2:quinone reductase
VRAVVLREFGPPDELAAAEVADPAPGPGQALVDVEIANITFVDTQLRAGRAPNPAMAPTPPAILGSGVGGVVAAVGDGADGSLVSSRVVASTGRGGYAERVAVDAAALIPVPDGLGLPEAVALLADGRTALSLVRTARVHAGETVLVPAAGGGVGSLLVQLATAAGARVVAAAGGGRKQELVRELGATSAVDYRQPDWAERVQAETGGGVDLAFDGVGGAVGLAAFELVRDGGRFSAFGMASGAFVRIPEGEAERRGITVIRGAPITPEDSRALQRQALAEAVAGRLRPVIGQRFPLEHAADAHAAIEARATIGKTLLVVRAPRERS